MNPEIGPREPRHDVKNLRLTCKHLSRIASATIFENGYLFSGNESYKRVRKVKKTPQSEIGVRTVILDYEFYFDEMDDYDSAWPGNWQRSMRRMKRFPNKESALLMYAEP